MDRALQILSASLSTFEALHVTAMNLTKCVTVAGDSPQVTTRANVFMRPSFYDHHPFIPPLLTPRNIRYKTFYTLFYKRKSRE